MSTSELPKGAVRQGGKEELRGSLLKTYLLRIRSEKGEREVRAILANAGIDPSMVDNETGWVSTHAAKKALRGASHRCVSIPRRKRERGHARRNVGGRRRFERRVRRCKGRRRGPDRSAA